MDIDIIDVDFEGITDLTRQTRLTIYDCCYLWLAIKFNAQLITLDKKLMKVALRLT